MKSRIKFLEFRLRLLVELIEKYAILANIASRSDYTQFQIYQEKILFYETRWLELDNELQHLKSWEEFKVA